MQVFTRRNYIAGLILEVVAKKDWRKIGRSKVCVCVRVFAGRPEAGSHFDGTSYTLYSEETLLVEPTRARD